MTCGYCGKDEASGSLTTNEGPTCFPCWQRLVESWKSAKCKPTTQEKP